MKIYLAVDHEGPKANCFACGGFARPESLRGGTMQTQGLLWKTAERIVFQSRYIQTIQRINQ